jgi:cardiolipin synthase
MVITLPNILTTLRIFIIPFFVIAVWNGNMTNACILFVAASITDILDGYLARKLNQKSALGAILDPIADKLLIATAFITLGFSKNAWMTHIPIWIIIIAIARDAVIVTTAVLTYNISDANKFKPSILGKLTTFVEIIVIFVSLLNSTHHYGWHKLVIPWIYYLMASMIVASAAHYTFRKNNS